MQQINEIKKCLIRNGLNIALNHLDQAEKSFAAGNWEAANGQIRTFLEALFDGVADLRLKSSAKGGEARKLLEKNGIISEKEARFIQNFMGLAGESGSHPGISCKEDANVRWSGMISVALLAIFLLPDMIKVEDILTKQLSAPDGCRLPLDSEIITECPTCGTKQTLGEAEVTRKGQETVYICKKGCQIILVDGLPCKPSWPGRGLKFGNHVIRNARELILPLFDADNRISHPSISLPASPYALAEKRDTPI